MCTNEQPWRVVGAGLAAVRHVLSEDRSLTDEMVRVYAEVPDGCERRRTRAAG